jgi:hypothetical protein
MSYEKIIKESLLAIIIGVVCLVIGFVAGHTSGSNNITGVSSVEATSTTPSPSF